MTFRHHFLTYTLLLTLLLVTAGACSSGQKEEDRHRFHLQQIDDSVAAHSPHAKAIIEQGMKQATDSIEYHEYNVRLARTYYFSRDIEAALPLVEGTIAYVKRQPATPRINSLLAMAYSTKSNIYKAFHHDISEETRLNAEAYRLLQHSDTPHNLPNICANLGDNYYATNDLPKAAEWYRRALFLADSLHTPRKEYITLYMGLGQIYTTLYDFEAAERCYRETDSQFADMSPSMQAYFLNNYGNLYYYAENYPQALKIFLRLSDTLKKYGMEKNFDMYLCRLNLADVYLNLGQLDEARDNLDAIEPFFIANGDQLALYYTHTIRIGIAVKRGDRAAVTRILATEPKTKDIPASLVDIRDKYLRDYYTLSGDYRRAYDNLLSAGIRNDSLEHNRLNMRSADIMARFAQDTLALHHRIEMEHKDAVISQAHLTTVVAAGIIVMLVLLTFIGALHSRKQRLQGQMRVMQLKLGNARNRISPHFVFNVLNNKITNAPEAEAAELQELTRLIRANLDMSCQPTMPLDRELEFVRQYVRIEGFLVGNDFDFTIHTPQSFDLSTVVIPSMFLQILVENALVHGLRGWQGHKTLTIDITRGEGMTTVAVTDNGPGFDARNGATKKRTGLGIITQTIAIANEHSKRKMRFDLNNLHDDQGHVTGCRATLQLPDGLRLIDTL